MVFFAERIPASISGKIRSPFTSICGRLPGTSGGPSSTPIDRVNCESATSYLCSMGCVMCFGARLKTMPQIVTATRVKPTTIAMPPTGTLIPKRSILFAKMPRRASVPPRILRVCFSPRAVIAASGMSELWTEPGEEVFPGLFAQGAVGPLLVGYSPRALQVVLEVGDLAQRELAVVDVQVRLVVQAEGAAVEIRRAHGSPQAVDHQHLAVVHRGLELVDLGARLQDRAPQRARGAAHEGGVRGLSRHDDAHFDSAPERGAQALEREIVRDEISHREVDALSRGGDRQQVHEVHALRAAVRRAAEDLRELRARRLQGWEIALAVKHDAAHLGPVVGKGRLHLRHYRTLDPVMRVAPMVGVLRVAVPFVGNA